MLLAHLDQKCMKLVEEGGLARQVRVQELLGLMVARISGDDTVPRQNPPRISIRHEEGTPGRIEEDRIGGFRAHSPKPQQPVAEFSAGREKSLDSEPPCSRSSQSTKFLMVRAFCR